MQRLLNYLKAAFWVREKIPLLGHVPVNVLAVLGFVALGFGHPAFWLLGLLGETAFLWAMAGSKRFRNLVDAQEAYADVESKQAARDKLLEQLIPPNRDRFERLDTKLHQVSEFYREFARGDVSADDNRANLKTLEDVYLRLLVARQHLSSSNAEADEQKIREQILRLETRLKDPASSLSAAARESKKATLELLEKRLAVFAKRDEAIEEIDADLIRIETQFELAADSAAIRAKPSEAKLDLDLASRMMSTPEYLDLGSSSDVAEEPMTMAWESA